MRVLLVDDEPGIVEQGKIFLEKEGNFFLKDENESMKVDSVQTIEEAFDKIDSNDYDAIISDYKMPDKTGIDLLKDLREDGNEIPFIMFTGKGWEEVAMKALNLGADQYLQKGWDPKAQYGVLAKSIVQVVEKKRNQKMYETLFETADDALFIMDEDRFIECNQRALDMFNCERKDIIGESPYDLFSPSHQPDGRFSMEKAKEKINRALDGRSQFFEWKHKTLDGEVFDAEVMLNSMKISGRQYLLSIVRDITERKRAQRRVEEEKRKLQKYIDVADVIMLVLDEDNRVKMINEEGRKILGYDKDEIEGENWFEKFIPDDRKEKAIEEFKRLISDEVENYQDRILPVITDEDEKRIINWNHTVLKEDGKVIGTLSSGNDITDLKRAEEKFRKFFDEMKDAIFITTIGGDNPGEIIDANPAAVEQTGYSIEELKGMSIIDDISVRDSEGWEHGTNENELIDKGEIRFTEKKRKKDGTTYWTEVIVTSIEDEGEKVALSVNRDITDRKEMEEKLITAKDKIEHLHRVASKMESVKHREDVYELTIDSAKKILEFDICDLLIPEGDELIIESTSSDDDKQELITVPIKGSIAGRTYREKETFMIEDSEDGDTEGYESVISVPIGDFGVFQAKSSDKSAFDEDDVELAELLISYTKNALSRINVDEREQFLLTLLRHDLKNKTQVIRGYLQILEDADISEKYKDMVEKTMKATIESQDLLEKVGILKEIKLEEGSREVNVDMFLKDAIEDNRDKLDEKSIEVQYENKSADVMGGPLLKELFGNIIENSILHGEADTIRISIEEGDEVMITVEDDGRGIKSDKRDEIFKRGYKGKGSTGLGIGLHLAKSIAENYGGSIEVHDSELGGVRFEVILEAP